MNGGLMTNAGTGTTKFEYQDLPQEVAKAVYSLNVGEISAPFSTMSQELGREVYAFVKVKSKIANHKANLTDDYQQLKQYYLAFKSQEIIQKWGGYTIDFNKNNINDSWEKLAHAMCIDPDGALQSISIGRFQVMGTYYKELGYNHPIDLLWDASRSEMAHYKMLAGLS